jgi:hypothetical protein
LGLSDDIELIGSTAPATDGDVETAGAGGRSGLTLVAVVAVVALAVLSLSGGDDEFPPPPSLIEPRDELPVDVALGTVVGDGPVLGPDTGLSLIAGGPNTPLRVLDLDNGDLTASAAVMDPRFMVGSTLVFRAGERSWFRDELGEILSGRPVDDGSRFLPYREPAHVVPHDEQTVWLTWPRIDRRRDWQLIDLVTLSVLREVTTPVEARILGGDAPFTGPDVVGFTTGGVHELLDDGSYRQVLDGRLVAVGQDEVVVRQCLPDSTCAVSWFDRATWALSDRPQPEGALINGRLVAGGRLLAATVGRFSFGAGLYDVDSGERLRSLGPIPLGDVRLSPDGEWLLRRLFGRVEVVEVATGAAVEVPDFPLGGGDTVIWLETSVVREAR